MSVVTDRFQARRPVVIAVLLTVISAMTAPLASAASAAKPQLIGFVSVNHSFAEAFWQVDGDICNGGTSTDFFVAVSDSHRTTPFLDVTEEVIHWDVTPTANGCAFVSSTFTDTVISATSGFSTTFTNPLAGAAVTASGLSGTTCTHDVSFNQIGDCSTSTVDLAVTWAGQGPIDRNGHHELIKAPGLVINSWAAGSFRDATATGSIGGTSLPASLEADLSTSTQGQICIGLCS